MSIETIPKEMSFQIISYLEIKDLGRCARVSTGWNSATYNDSVIREWFRCKFNETLLPLDIPAKTALCKRLTQVSVDSMSELQKVVISFLCTVKWETKRRLECEFPHAPAYSLVIEQGCNSNYVTPQNFKFFAAEQTEYCSYQGKDDFFAYKNADYVFKNTFNYLLCETFSCRIIRQASSVKVSSMYYENGIRPHITIDPLLYPLCSLYVTDIDVGYGNTLGYYSKINNWKRHFKLMNINRSTWCGIIPLQIQFKFIKITQTGEVVWENDGFPTEFNSVEGSKLGIRNQNRVVLSNLVYYDPSRCSVDGRNIKFPS